MDAGRQSAKVAALILLSLGVGFFLLFTIGEVADGDTTGLQHLPPALVLGALLWLAWKRPRQAARALLAITALLVIADIGLLATYGPSLGFALVVVLPSLVVWLLLSHAERREPKRR